MQRDALVEALTVKGSSDDRTPAPRRYRGSINATTSDGNRAYEAFAAATGSVLCLADHAA